MQLGCSYHEVVWNWAWQDVTLLEPCRALTFIIETVWTDECNCLLVLITTYVSSVLDKTPFHFGESILKISFLCETQHCLSFWMSKEMYVGIPLLCGCLKFTLKPFSSLCWWCSAHRDPQMTFLSMLWFYRLDCWLTVIPECNASPGACFMQ
jgi:hypothetical protein